MLRPSLILSSVELAISSLATSILDRFSLSRVPTPSSNMNSPRDSLIESIDTLLNTDSVLSSNQIKPDVIILDPPRKGCDEALIKTVAKMSPKRVVYVSCDPATLARDCAVFATLGYTVPEENGKHFVTPVDLFPKTVHTECVCLLTRSD